MAKKLISVRVDQDILDNAIKELKGNRSEAIEEGLRRICKKKRNTLL